MPLQHLDAVIGFAVIMLLLSLVITVLVQLVVGVAGMRGSNLQWGLERLLAHVGLPADKRRLIADRILRHELIRRSAVGGYLERATDIRRDEFLRLLGTVAHDKDLASDADLASALARLSDIQAWFNGVMDRTTERFVSKTRWIGAAFAVALVAVLQVDALYIFERIERDAGLRARLVAAAPQVLSLADSADARTDAARSLATASLIEARDSLDPRLRTLVPDTIPEGLRFLDQGRTWITGEVADSTARAQLLLAFGRSYERNSRRSAELLDSTLTGLMAEVRDTTFILLRPERASLAEPRHLLGMLLAIGFLSLGSPFWYNALRQLSNLRPIVAGKIARDSDTSGPE